MPLSPEHICCRAALSLNFLWPEAFRTHLFALLEATGNMSPYVACLLYILHMQPSVLGGRFACCHHLSAYMRSAFNIKQDTSDFLRLSQTDYLWGLEILWDELFGSVGSRCQSGSQRPTARFCAARYAARYAAIYFCRYFCVFHKVENGLNDAGCFGTRSQFLQNVCAIRHLWTLKL